MLTEQEYELVPVEKLSAHPDNPRSGDVDAIASSIEANGFYGAVVAQRSSGRILAGNHRWKAAAVAGQVTVPVIWVDVDDDRARRILLADNRTNDRAGYDDVALLSLLEDLAVSEATLAGTGYDLLALDDLRAAAGDMDTLAPQETDASHADVTAKEAERAANAGQVPSIHEAGLRELILVYPIATQEETLALIRRLRDASEFTTSDVVLAALRFAVRAELDPAEYLDK